MVSYLIFRLLFCLCRTPRKYYSQSIFLGCQDETFKENDLLYRTITPHVVVALTFTKNAQKDGQTIFL
jgi:hypothetical protein